jgi:hypothetical protein
MNRVVSVALHVAGAGRNSLVRELANGVRKKRNESRLASAICADKAEDLKVTRKVYIKLVDPAIVANDKPPKLQVWVWHLIPRLIDYRNHQI